jgi:hypothetical protein
MITNLTMKFDQIIPEIVFRVDNEGECYVCGDPTHHVHKDFDVFICSDECLEQIEDILFGK